MTKLTIHERWINTYIHTFWYDQDHDILSGLPNVGTLGFKQSTYSTIHRYIETKPHHGSCVLFINNPTNLHYCIVIWRCCNFTSIDIFKQISHSKIFMMIRSTISAQVLWHFCFSCQPAQNRVCLGTFINFDFNFMPLRIYLDTLEIRFSTSSTS